MEMIAISAARWAVGKALGPVSDGLLESWAACSELGPNIRALKMQLLYAQGMLDNARGRDVRSPALGQLLLELGHQAYDADDVLDELEYFRIQDELDGTYETSDNADTRGLVGGLALNAHHTARAVVSKLKLPSCSCASVVCQHHRKTKLKFDRVAISKRMVEIVEQLKPLCAMVSTILDLELQGTIASTGTTALQGIAFTQSTRTTTRQIIEPNLYGRDKVKMDVIDGITSKYQANGLTVLSIVGPGGLGKTTLTQHICEEVKSHFQVLVWVCVSQNFSASRLAQEIVKQIPKLDNENGNESAEDLIEKRLQSKQFFLALDDMWTYQENEWKKLLAPFKKVQTKGNMVIVTTRIPKVAQMVTTVGCPIRLERLSDEECMCFFHECVFGDQQTWEGHTNLHDFGCKIVKRLKGFPLAVKTVGRLLKTELTAEHWRRVLESKEWEYQASEDDIMPALKLSYNYLPFHLQQCFSHCAMFPEDYEFEREELILLWIGLGLLVPNDQNKRIEDIGLGYLSDLVSHGFFQEDKKEDGCTYYVIHDLLHDLARNVSAHECLSIQGSNVWTIQIPASICHMSIIINNADVQDKTTFKTCKRDLNTLGKRLKAGNLRTLMLFGDHHGSLCKIFSDMFQEAKALRVIFLSGASYDVEELFPRFSQLVHLRYLRIKGYVFNGRSLFDIMSRFYNLLVLDLKECYIFSSAHTEDTCTSTRDMSSLLKIRHLLVKDDSYHSEIFEVGKLKSIQELRRFEVKREKHGFELNQLRQLLQLQGSLEIHDLEKVAVTTEAEEIKLVHMHHLNRLILHWGGNQSNRDPEMEQDVLECLKPHSNLQEVCIRGHGGHTYPTWLCADHCVKNLECLCLKDVAWKSLPPLLGELLTVGEERPSIAGQSFHNLKRLELVNIATLKKWTADRPFSKLEVLTVKDCSELTELPFLHMFPILQQIYILDCVKLVSVPPIPWSSLSKAELMRVGANIQFINYRKIEQKMSVWFKRGAPDYEILNVLAFSNLSEIKDFMISECSPVPLHHLQLLNSLKTLVIRHYSSVLWPTEGENNSPFKFPVEQLEISDCGATVTELAQLISYFPNLSTLGLWRCDNKQAGGAEETEAAAGGQLPLPPQLKELLQNLSSLRSLCIGDCPMLLSSSSLPSFYCPFPTSLQSLVLGGVKDDMLTLSPLTNLTKLDLYDCEGLRSEDLWYLLGQGCLKELEIQEVYNLLDIPEPSRMCECEQDLPQDSSMLEALETDGEAGAVAVPMCVHFSSSLTNLKLYGNRDMEHFTKEQSKALQMLTSIQVLTIQCYSRLQSLPDGLRGFPNLKILEIVACSSIRLLPKGGLPSSLVELHILNCDAILSLPKGTLPSSLTELHILRCRIFRSLPRGSLPSSLKRLSIRYSPSYYLINCSLPCHIALYAISNTATVLGTLSVSLIWFFNYFQLLELCCNFVLESLLHT